MHQRRVPRRLAPRLAQSLRPQPVLPAVVEAQERDDDHEHGVARQVHREGDEVPRGVAREEDLGACMFILLSG